ncbi:MAG: DEAD/DEAH box helicase [Candidatus Berkelbacteria bacterium]
MQRNSSAGNFGRRPGSKFRSNSGMSNGNSRPSFSRSNNRGNSGRQKFRGERIDVSKFINKSIDKKPVVAVEIKNAFSDFPFCKELQDNLKQRNYLSPTPIQDQSINYILDGRDLIGLANTGTGKTAAFLLPLINKVYNDRSQKVLIITPTRELAFQIEEELRKFSWGMRIFFACCVGGAPIHKQMGNLRREPNFVIGTPGRLNDLIDRGYIKLPEFNNIVLDEVDRMLDMGFINTITEMLKVMPVERQSLFFSATLPIKIRGFIGQFLKNPVTIEVKTGDTAENIDQDVVRFENETTKFDHLSNLLKSPDFQRVLVFAETKMEVERLTSSLLVGGFKVESIHSNKNQSQRSRTLSQFKTGAINIMVATDVAARGLDIKDVTHVINYTIPQTYNDYVHRIGRTGRGASSGKALTFVQA